MSLNDPFLLSPAGKDYLWGGRRLKDDFGKENIPLDPLAETWECSTHPNGPSTIASGEFKGKLLSEVIAEHPEILGTHPHCTKGQIPILVKFIDAKKNLSIKSYYKRLITGRPDAFWAGLFSSSEERARASKDTRLQGS